jgi:hypothetical protein
LAFFPENKTHQLRNFFAIASQKQLFIADLRRRCGAGALQGEGMCLRCDSGRAFFILPICHLPIYFSIFEARKKANTL